MNRSNYLEVSDVYKLDKPITEVAVVDATIFVNTPDELFILDSEFKSIQKDTLSYCNALEITGEEISLIYEKENKLFYQKNQNIIDSIDVTSKEQIKDIFLFHDILYVLIEYENGTFDIYSLFAKKVLCNLEFKKEVFSVYKYQIENELIVVFKDEAIIFDIKTLTIKSTIAISDSDFKKAVVFEEKLHLVYKNCIKVMKSEEEIFTIDLKKDDIVENVFLSVEFQCLVLYSQKSIYLFHIPSNSFFPIYDSIDSIQGVFVVNSNLYVASEYQILKINILKGEQDIEKYLLLRNKEKVLELVEKNPFLICKKEKYQAIHTFFKEQYNQISMKFLMDKENEALELFKGFEIFDSFKDDFEELQSNKSIFTTLAISFKNLDFKSVFNMLHSYPFLKQTPLGNKAQNDWLNALDKFTVYLLQNEFDEKSKEYNVVKKYTADNEKNKLIDLMIKNQENLLNSVKAYREKHIMVFANTVNSCHFLVQLPFVKKLFDKMYNDTLRYIEERNYEEVDKKLKYLKFFDTLKEKAQNLQDKVAVYKSFENALLLDDLTKCYNYLEKYKEYFKNTKYLEIVLHQDTKKIDQAFLEISNNHLETAFKKIKDRFSIEIWFIKLNYLMRYYYVKEYGKIANELNETQIQQYKKYFFKIFGVEGDDKNNYFKLRHITNYPNTLLQEIKK